jgi:hypothetical protein
VKGGNDMDVQIWLDSIKKMDEQINDMLDEQHRLFSVATDISPRPMDGMPFNDTGTVSQKMQNAACARVDLGRKIDALIDKFIDRKRQVLTALDKLPAFEREIMYRHYIQYQTWVQIANDTGYSTTQLWRIRQRIYPNILG